VCVRVWAGGQSHSRLADSCSATVSPLRARLVLSWDLRGTSMQGATVARAESYPLELLSRSGVAIPTPKKNGFNVRIAASLNSLGNSTQARTVWGVVF